MLIQKNIIIKPDADKPIVLDVGYQANGIQKPVVIFAHGFKGFKDWGHFNMMMEHFVAHNYVFVKFNFSHNGGTVEQPIDFPDLEAFGNNNYTKELNDLKSVVDWVEDNPKVPKKEMDLNQIFLIGHSRGGGVAVLAAHEDKRIKKLVCWAPVADLINRFSSNQLKEWKEKGVMYIPNARTKQEMPLYYQLAEDTLNNKERFNICKAAKALSIPHLIVHGTQDEAVDISEGRSIRQWSVASAFFVVEGGNHTFGAYHPYLEKNMPEDAQKVLTRTLAFLGE